jgi:hypothetical protein
MRILSVMALWSVAASASAEEAIFDARRLADSAVMRDVELSPEGKSIVLRRGVLVADDGPAAGFSYRPNEESLTEGIRIRKDLSIGDPRARSADLLIGGSGAFDAVINGNVVSLKNPTKAGNYWQSFKIPVESLKSENRVELRGKGKLWIARDDEFASGANDGERPPNRSARSTDDGATWSDERLGPRGDIDGEYAVRLFLDRSHPSGTLALPVIDLANLEETRIAPAIEGEPGPFGIEFSGTCTDQTRIDYRLRAGSTPTPDKDWSAWKNFDWQKSHHENISGRYLQIEVMLSASDPLQTPRLNSVRVIASPRVTTTWTKKWRAREWKNAEIVRTSIPFRYEPFDHSRLKQFREKHHLDEVVSGTDNEWKQIERLAAWASQQWESGHLGKVYPAWDALEILAPYSDGKPVGGFCQQYNLVFLQACEALGIVGRCVSIGSGDHGVSIRSGHEVIEVWSNDFAKWIYIDGNAAWYFRDVATGAPLSLRELRERQLAAIDKKQFDEVKLVTLAKTKYEWTDLTGWPAFTELRMIPRSNFLEQKSPLPLNQGMRGWFWTGHYAWTDAAYPASLLYGHRISQARNWDWTLNQAAVRLEATNVENEVRVHLDTVTPGFQTFVAQVDAEEARPVESGFTWRLKPGTNRVRVWPRNVAGRSGVVSQLELTDSK